MDPKYFEKMATEIPSMESLNGLREIEINTGFHESMLWEMIKNYYIQLGNEAWSYNIVPYYITSNSKIARDYSKIIINYTKDVSVDRSNIPINVIEVGAGHGILTFLILKELNQYQDLFKHMNLPLKPYKYICTDISRNNIDFCMKHKKLIPFIESKVLDFAVIEDNFQTQFETIISECPIDKNKPAVIICNYVIDSMPTYSLKFKNNSLYQGNISIYSACDAISIKDIFYNMQVEWTWVKIDIESIKDELSIRLAKYYEKLNVDMSLTIPYGGIKMVENIIKLCNGNMMLLIGDKGYSNLEDIKMNKNSFPHLSRHGCCSTMVNIHAMGLAIHIMGGIIFNSPWVDSFQVSMILINKSEDSVEPDYDSQDFDILNKANLDKFSIKLGGTIGSYCETVGEIIPDFIVSFNKLFSSDINGKSLRLALSYLRLCNHDTHAFLAVKNVLLSIDDTIHYRIVNDIIYDLKKVLSNNYTLKTIADEFPLDIVTEGVINVLVKLGSYKHAIDLIESCAKNALYKCPITLTNLAWCYTATNNVTKAINLCNIALDLGLKSDQGPLDSTVELLNILNNNPNLNNNQL